MGLFGSRENLDQQGPGFGGNDYLGRLKDKLGKPSAKGEKKGAPIFGKDPFLPFGKFATRVEKDQGGAIFGKTKFARAKRKDLVNKTYVKEIMGTNVDAKDIEKAKGELKQGKWGKYGKYSPGERKGIKKMLDAFSEGKT